MDVRTIIVVSLVALVSFSLWSIWFGLTTAQSLQNQVDNSITEKNNLQIQVTSLQNQVALQNAQLAEKQREIKTLTAFVGVVDNLITQQRNLQNQVALQNAQLDENQDEIDNLKTLKRVYLKDIAKLLEQLYPEYARFVQKTTNWDLLPFLL